MISLVPINPYDKSGLLLPFVAQRVSEMAQQHMHELDPETWTRTVLSRLCAGDPHLLVLAFVGAKGDVVGHGVASIESFGPSKWVFISQCRVEPGEGSSDPTLVARAIECVDTWAKHGFGVTRMLMASPRSDEAWRRKYGFKTLRHVMEREVGAPIPGHQKD
jgi:hypothetical protein